jgi:ABC-type uncharacterized transport system permease subunit
VIVPAAIVVGSLAVPSAANVVLYFLSLALAFIVTLLIWLHVGLLSFWLLNVNGIRAMIAICSEFLAGALVPLWFMPGTLRFALELLPFQATTFLPASIYSGQVTGTAVMEPLAVQLLWIVILTLSSSFVWNRAQRKLVVQGG